MEKGLLLGRTQVSQREVSVVQRNLEAGVVWSRLDPVLEMQLVAEPLVG